MTSIDTKQFDQEPHLWKVKLEQFKQENVLLKYRLSEMVDNSEGNQFLQMAEFFQNELLIMDDKLQNLFFQFEQFSNFSQQLKNGKELPGDRTEDYNKLKNDISQFEKKFLDLSNEFHKKMSESRGD